MRMERKGHLRRAIGLAVAALVITPLAACSSSSSGDAANFAGTYSVSVTDTDNGCGYDGWTIGQSAQNVEFDVAQSGGSVTGNVKGAANIYFAVLGIGTFNGSANADAASMSAVGTTSVKKGACAYFVKAQIDVTLSGDAINGTVTYSNQTNGSSDCGALATCTSQQKIAGSRPPKA